MSTLVTAEFSNRDAATAVLEDLVAAGIPRDNVYVEVEHPDDAARSRQPGGVAYAEAERRFAGTETGVLVGTIFGLMCGLLLGAMNYYVALASGTGSGVSWPLNSAVWCGVLGLVGGGIVGAAIGATIDWTLNALGAGPPVPEQECLLTVIAADENGTEAARNVFHKHRARHVLAA